MQNRTREKLNKIKEIVQNMNVFVKENTEAIHSYLKEIEKNLDQSQSQYGKNSFSHSLYKSMLDPKKSSEDKKLELGKILYPKISEIEPDKSVYITGKILELDNSEILLLINNEDSLKEKIDEVKKNMEEEFVGI